MATVKKTTKKKVIRKPKKAVDTSTSSVSTLSKVERVEKPVISPREKYFEATGRRKTAVARVRISVAPENTFLVNGKPLDIYFANFELQQIIHSPLEKMNCLDKFEALVVVKGGGLHAQAEAVRHGVARALVLFNPDFRKKLKKAGYLKRDPRMRERKKFGLKRARRAPQWAKR